MSEKTFEDAHDKLMQEAFRKLEQDRAILIGSEFKKWRTSPVAYCSTALFSGLLLGAILAITRTEPTAFLLVFCALVAAVSAYQTELINKRINKIVQVTGAERKLEEECQATISQIARLESKKADA